MKDIDRSSLLAPTLFVIAAVVFSSGSWAAEDESFDSRGLVLDIYADDAGKALVTGYAKGIDGLSFLNDSEYQYDEDASQLYAVTNALTWKNGDDWEIRLPAEGSYDEYHVTFYLSENVQLSNITGTVGLDYLVSSSSDSFAVEFHGYDVVSPSAAVRYRQPLSNGMAESTASSLQPLQPAESSPRPLLLVGAFILVLIAIVAAVKSGMLGGVSSSPRKEEVSYDLGPAEAVREAGDEERLEVGAEFDPASLPISPVEDENVEARVSVEMTAVMETLTERERSVLEALIKNGGKMTQADIRYETGIPKSSLTGIIVSLERRKIVTKREWGRTNVIELSERLRGENENDQGL
ncbi:MAG TPA: helix-turn-helix domain-containing protein [Methanothrix sp.]|nr:helix-turn-helix domain-containing protein [Methanothrix sp.]HPJ83137.1 helix-turn-helix domain-containing protein [Methanothrix sp.]HPR65738.1 helix-turn-helix domain-containing protein [Methanothrix sp.]